MHVLSAKSISLFRVQNGKGFTLKQDFLLVSKVLSFDDIISVIVVFLIFSSSLLETELQLNFQQPSVFSPLSEEKC